MQEAAYLKCTNCTYEFLSSSKAPECPRCKSTKLETLDIKKVVGFDG